MARRGGFERDGEETNGRRDWRPSRLPRLAVPPTERIVAVAWGGNNEASTRCGASALRRVIAKPALAISSDEACAQLADAAESVMYARQNGVAM